MALQISKKHKKKDNNPHLLWFVHNINTHRSNQLQMLIKYTKARALKMLKESPLQVLAADQGSFTNST